MKLDEKIKELNDKIAQETGYIQTAYNELVTAFSATEEIIEE